MNGPGLLTEPMQYVTKRAKDTALFKLLFKTWPADLDRRWRHFDFHLNRNFGGALSRWPGIEGYSIVSFIVVALAVIWIVNGPALTMRGMATAAVIFSVLAILWRTVARRHASAAGRFNWVTVLHVTVACAAAAAVWAFSHETASAADGTLYRHSYLVLAILLYAVVLPFIGLIGRRMFRRERLPGEIDFRAALRNTELFRGAPVPPVDYQVIRRALVNAPLHYPLTLIFPPSLVAVFTPPAFRDLLWFYVIVALLGTWIVLSFASFHERIRAIFELTRRCLFVGGPLVVSLVVIVLGIGRLAEFGYVATVVEAARMTTFLYILCSYAVFWLFEYWMNRLLTERLLDPFLSKGDPIGRATYDIDPAKACEGVPAENRRLQIHGAARVIAIGGTPEKPCFESYERLEFLDALGAANPRHRRHFEEIRNRTKFFLSLVNLLLVILACISVWLLQRNKQQPQVVVKADEAHGSVDLRRLIFERSGASPNGHVILLAASGGGTRAALYTASVLHGLAARNELTNVVLASGVSGGSAALAYFAAHQPELETNNPAAWKRCYEALSKPFIQEVLQGATEWRITKGQRLGTLLGESFVRHLDLTNASIGESTNLALIFNTSLAGHLWQDSNLNTPFDDWANDHRRLTRSDVAGGRLIFTNLRQKEWFPRLDVSGSFRMKYVVVQNSNVPLASAAALSANFPPVFSNAAVDKDATNRFWVTDGGAADNRGIDALLFALRGALREQKRLGRPANFPVIHVIVADASAATIDYRQDRGMGSKFGAPEKFATQLMEELFAQIDDLSTNISGTTNLVRLHYLAMPNTLRMRGGLGTHWMLPPGVKLSDTSVRDAQDASYVRVNSEAIQKLISELHQTNTVFNVPASREQDIARSWILADEHRTNWVTLTSELVELKSARQRRGPSRKTMILEQRQTL